MFEKNSISCSEKWRLNEKKRRRTDSTLARLEKKGLESWRLDPAVDLGISEIGTGVGFALVELAGG